MVFTIFNLLIIVLLSDSNLALGESLFTNSTVYVAASSGYLKSVDVLLTLGWKVESLGEFGRTPLMGAVVAGHSEVVKLLLARGANIRAKSLTTGETPLHLAVRYNRKEIMDYLLYSDSSNLIEEKDNGGSSPLNTAVLYGRLEMAKTLINKGANLESRDVLGRTPVLNACAFGHLPILQLCVEKGANLKAISGTVDRESSAMHLAIYYGHADILQYLIGKAKDLLSTKNSDGESPLFVASVLGHQDIVRSILEADSDTRNENGPFGWNPFMAAVNFNRLDVLNALKNEDSISSRLESDYAPAAFFLAVQLGHMDIIKHFLANDQSLLEARNANESTPLHAAIEYGRLDSAEKLVEQGANLEAKNGIGQTALLHAVAVNSLPLVQFLLSRNADIQAKDRNGQFCSHLAAVNGFGELLQFLVKTDITLLEEKDVRGNTPLASAALAGRIDIVSILVSSLKANLETRDGLSYTPLLSATNAGHLEMVRTLLRLGANPKATTSEGDTAIHLAVKMAHVEVVEYLVTNVRSVLEFVNNQSDNAICVAAQTDHISVVKCLLKFGASIESFCGDSNFTPLMMATKSKKRAMVSYFLSNGANLLAKCGDYLETAFHLAARLGHIDVLTAMLDSSQGQAALKSTNKFGQTALWVAAFNGHRQIVEFLTKNGAIIEAGDSTKRTPLFAAISANNTQITSFLIEKGADVRVTTTSDDLSMTPLIFASKLGYSEIIEILLNKYPQLVDQRNDNFEYPLSIAISAGHLNAVKSLLRYSLSQIERKVNGRNALLQACVSGSDQIVDLLLQKGADVWSRSNSEEDEANTGFHLAAKFGHSNVLQILYNSAKELLETQNKNGFTPLYVAAVNGQEEIVEYLLKLGAKCQAQGSAGFSPFIAAASANQLGVLRVFFEKREECISSKTKYENGENMAIHVAAAQGKREAVEFLLHEDPHLSSATNRFGDTPLIFAASNNQLPVIEVLLQFQANLETRGRYGFTAFLASAAYGCLGIVKFFHSKTNANMSARSNYDDEERLAVHLSASNGHLEVMKYLIQTNVNQIESSTREGNTPLWLASNYGHADIVSWLVSNRANIEAKGKHGWTPLIAATSKGQTSVMTILLENRANIMARSKKSSDENLAIHIAVYGGHTSAIELLLKQSPVLKEAKNAKGWTPLLTSCVAGQVAVLGHLIKIGCNVGAKSNALDGGNSGMHLAAIFNQPTIMQALYDATGRALLESTNNNGEQPLWRAAQLGNNEAVDRLLSLGAPVDLQCPMGFSALAAAVVANRPVSASKLILKGANMNLKAGIEGNNAFHLASLYGSTETLRTFLKRKVDLEIPNKFGESGFWLAAYGGAKSTVAFLLSQGSQIFSSGRKGWSALHAAASNGHLPVVQLLASRGFPLDTRSESTESVAAIHVAASYGFKNIVSFLVEKLPKLLELKDSNNNTALFLAAQENRTNVVGELMALKADCRAEGMNNLTPFHAASIRGNIKVLQMMLAKDSGLLVSKAGPDDFMAIHSAAMVGQDETVRFLTQIDGNSVELRNRHSDTAILIAAQYGQLSTVKLLYLSRADVESRGRYGWSPLLAASSNCRVSVVEYLINEVRANIFAKSDYDSGGNNALHLATLNNCSQVVALLIRSNRALAPIRNRENNTALWLASSLGYSQIVSLLLDVRNTVDTVGKHDHSPLMIAVLNQHLPAVRLLIQYGASVYQRGNSGDNILHFAASNGLLGAVQTILELKPELLNSIDEDGNSALIKAGLNGHSDVLSYLLKRGADVSLSNRDGHSAFHAAAKAGKWDFLERLVDSGKFQLDSVDKAGRSPMQWAVVSNNLRAVKLLLSKGANIAERNLDSGSESIHLASSHGHMEMVEYLLSVKPALIEVTDDRKETPLFYAVRNNQKDLTRVLLARKANVNARNSAGETPLMVASSLNLASLVEVLVNGGADIEAKQLGGNGDTVVHFAAKAGQMEILTFLLSKMTRTLRNDKDETPLWTASHLGLNNVVQRICDMWKYDLDAPDSAGRTPLYIAAATGNHETCRVLLSHGASFSKKAGTKDQFEFPIHAAVTNKHMETVKALLSVDNRGSSNQFKLMNSNGSTPLCLAVELGYDDFIRQLVLGGADVEGRCSGFTPLMIAINRKQLKSVETLIENGASAAAKTAPRKGNETVFHLAARSGDKSSLELLIKLQPSYLEEKNVRDETSLFVAAAMGDAEMLEFLINRGANLETQAKGVTPLFKSILQGRIRIMKLLILAGAMLEARGPNGRTVLLEATARCRLNTVKYLLSMGADLNARCGEYNDTIFHVAIASNCIELIKFLQNSHPHLGNKRNALGQTGVSLVDSNKRLKSSLDDSTVKLFLNAVKLGRFSTIRTSITNGIDLMSRTPYSEGWNTAIHLACVAGHMRVVDLLLAEKPELISVTNGFGDTPLHMAALSGRKALVEMLLKFNPKIEARGRYGWTPFLAAVQSGNWGVVKLLYSKGANVSARSNVENNFEAAIHVAARYGRDLLINEMLDANIASTSAVTNKGETALILASRSGHLNVLNVLIRRDKMLLTHRDSNGFTALLAAAGLGHYKIVEYLLDYDEDLGYAKTFARHGGNNALHLAILNSPNDKADIIYEMLRRFPDMVDERNAYGETAIYIAATVSDISVIDQLSHEYDGSLTSRCIFGLTPLMSATIRNRKSVVKKLVDMGADITETSTSTNDMAIHFAALHGHVDLLEFFIANVSQGVDVENKNGQTPLWKAASVGQVEAIKYLLKLGANPDLPDKKGVTPLDIARAQGRWNAIKSMFTSSNTPNEDDAPKSVMPNPIAPSGMTLYTRSLYEVVESGNLNAVKSMVESKPNLLDEIDEEVGETPIFAAINANKEDIAEYLIGKGCSIRTRNTQGFTPLLVAAMRNKPSMIRLLTRAGADIQERTTDLSGDLAIHLAIRHGSIEAVEELLDTLSSFTDIPNAQKETPLFLALNGGHFSIAKLLITRKAGLETRLSSGLTLFLHYVANNQVEVVKFLLQNGANAAAKSTGGDTALHLSSRLGLLEIARFLIANEPSLLERTNDFGNTALWGACGIGNLNIVQLLIEQGHANIKTRGNGTLTPLLAAVTFNKLNVVEYLIEQGADIRENVLDSTKNQAIHIASSMGYLAIVRRLIQRDTSLLEETNALKETPLLLAAKGSFFELADFLISAGADINHRSSKGLSPLLIAVVNDQVKTVEYLLNKGADFRQSTGPSNGQLTAMHLAVALQKNDLIVKLHSLHPEMMELPNGNGETPLLYGSYIGSKTSIPLLVRLGAKPLTYCTSGWSPLIAAAVRGRVDVCRNLMLNGIMVENQLTQNDDEGNNPLIMAALYGRLEVVNALALPNNVNLANRQGETALWKAASSGHLEIVKFLRNSFDVKLDVRGRKSLTPLHIAAANGHVDVVKYLLQQNADSSVMTLDNSSYTPAHLAASLGRAEVVQAFVKEQNRLLESNPAQTGTLLWVAAAHGRIEVVKTLLGFNPNLEARGPLGRTPLHEAAARGFALTVKLLRDKGANVETKSLGGDKDKPFESAVANGHFAVASLLVSANSTDSADGEDSPLYKAASEGQLYSVRLLVMLGANVNAPNKMGWTPLMAACSKNHVNVVRFLVRKGKADLYARTIASERENTAIHLACINNSTDVVKFLISYQPKLIHVKNGAGNVPLWLAAFYGHVGIVQFLIAKQAPLNTVPGFNGWSPLLAAAAQNHYEVVKVLARNGASVIARSMDIKRETAMHMACSLGNLDMARYLFASDRRVLEMKDGNQETPLVRAFNGGHSNIVQFLLAKGASMQFTGDSGMIILATQSNNEQTVSTLLASGASPDYVDKDGRTALMWATLNGYIPVVKVLLEGKANVRLQSNNSKDGGNTVIHFAVASKRLDLLSLILKADKGAVDVKNFKEQTPLIFAAELEYIEMIERLLTFGASVNARDSEGRNAFLIAIDKGSLETAYLLGQKGSLVNVETSERDNALHLAARRGYFEVFKWLADRSSGYPNLFEATNKNGETPLFCAVINGNTEVASYLFNRYFRSEQTDNRGINLLQAAAIGGSVQIFKTLITNLRLDAYVKTSKGEHVVHLAAANNRAALIEHVLTGPYGSHNFLETTNSNGDAPISIAAANGAADAIKTLAKYGANVEFRNSRSWTPLMIAAANGHLSAVTTLVDLGATIESPSGVSDTKATALHFAAAKGNLAILKYLLSKKPQLLEIGNAIGTTPLAEASVAGNADIVDYLIKQGANVNAKALNGQAPLWRASQVGKAAVVELLIAAGADIESTGQYGRTSLLAASAYDHKDVVKVLIEHGANINARGHPNIDGGFTALHLAVKFNAPEVAKYLKVAKPELLTIRNSKGQTPLELANALNNKAMISLLL